MKTFRSFVELENKINEKNGLKLDKKQNFGVISVFSKNSDKKDWFVLTITNTNKDWTVENLNKLLNNKETILSDDNQKSWSLKDNKFKYNNVEILVDNNKINKIIGFIKNV